MPAGHLERHRGRLRPQDLHQLPGGDLQHGGRPAGESMCMSQIKVEALVRFWIWGGGGGVAGKIRSYVACARGMIVSPKVVRAGGMFPSLMIRTHTRAHARTHARTRASTHARTHARTQTQAERERERETESTKGTQTECQAIHTHTKYTNTNKTPFFFLIFESF